ncbi:MAG: biotin/lipoyl-containing protein, partial [Solirubrobacteraceae bacterium]
MSEGTILEWRKSEGDHVSAEETLVEISTDKVDAEVAAPIAGTVVKIHAAAGETVAVGALLAEIAPNGATPPPASATPPEASATPPPASATPPEPAARPSTQGTQTASGNGAAAAPDTGAQPTTIDIVTPAAGESVTEGTILDWTVKIGDSVAAGDTIVEISTDKVDVELPAPAAGTITELLVSAGDTVTVGQVIARMTSASASGASTDAGANATPTAPPSPQPQTDGDGAALSDGAKASPVARRAAAALHVDLGSLAGSGPDGRIVKDDVLAAAERPAAAAEPTGAPDAGSAATVSELRGGAAMLVRYMEESRSIPT